MDIKYDLNQKTIYQIFVRNYSKQGRFKKTCWKQIRTE